MKNFFENCKSLEELKAEFRRLVKKYHPDCGGDAETMKDGPGGERTGRNFAKSARML
ncbi:MAG: J domain-containing protein [Oscillospiraceae bacterium]|nr:J domain-containing protein [Oscillospiraceae bacterium]